MAATALDLKSVKKFTAKVLEVKPIASDVKVFTLEVPKDFMFKPGQFVMLGINDGKMIRRAFSIASPPAQKGSIEVCIKILESGLLSSRINKYEAGDTLQVQGPYGAFVLQEPVQKELIFLAAGTGIAPIMSMAEHALASGVTTPITLIFGFRHHDFFLYEKELAALTEKHDNFTLITLCSQPDTAWKGETGYVQDVIEKYAPNGKNKQAYICGHPKMVHACVGTLKKAGYTDIRREAWGE